MFLKGKGTESLKNKHFQVRLKKVNPTDFCFRET